MPEYKIRYKDGRSHMITADKYGLREQFFHFTRDDKSVFTVDRNDVESVGLGDIPAPELPEVKVSTPGRSGKVRGFS